MWTSDDPQLRKNAPVRLGDVTGGAWFPRDFAELKNFLCNSLPFAQAKSGSSAFRPIAFSAHGPIPIRYPNNRISENPNQFTAYVLSLSLGLVTSVVSLVSFLVMLWRTNLWDRACQPRREENSGSFHSRAFFLTRAAGTSPPVFPSVDCASAGVIHADFPIE